MVLGFLGEIGGGVDDGFLVFFEILEVFGKFFPGVLCLVGEIGPFVVADFGDVIFIGVGNGEEGLEDVDDAGLVLAELGGERDERLGVGEEEDVAAAVDGRWRRLR